MSSSLFEELDQLCRMPDWLGEFGTGILLAFLLFIALIVFTRLRKRRKND